MNTAVGFTLAFLSSWFREQITCPLCNESIPISRAAESGTIEFLGKDMKGHTHIKHVSCGAYIVWDRLSGKNGSVANFGV